MITSSEAHPNEDLETTVKTLTSPPTAETWVIDGYTYDTTPVLPTRPKGFFTRFLTLFSSTDYQGRRETPEAYLTRLIEKADLIEESSGYVFVHVGKIILYFVYKQPGRTLPDHTSLLYVNWRYRREHLQHYDSKAIPKPQMLLFSVPNHAPLSSIIEQHAEEERAKTKQAGKEATHGEEPTPDTTENQREDTTPPTTVHSTEDLERKVTTETTAETLLSQSPGEITAGNKTTWILRGYVEERAYLLPQKPEGLLVRWKRQDLHIREKETVEEYFTRMIRQADFIGESNDEVYIRKGHVILHFGYVPPLQKDDPQPTLYFLKWFDARKRPEPEDCERVPPPHRLIFEPERVI